MQIRLRILIWFCLMTAMGSYAVAVDPPETTANPEAVRDAVSRMWKEHIAAAVHKDAVAVMQIYAEDCVYVVPGSADVRGHTEISEMESQTLATADVLDARHTIDALEVYGDVAYEIGTVEGPVRPHGQAARVVTFHFMAQWRRQSDGGWKIAHMVGLPEPPAPE